MRLHHEVCLKTVDSASAGQQQRVDYAQSEIDWNKISRQDTSPLASSQSSSFIPSSNFFSRPIPSSSSSSIPRSQTSCRGLYNPSAYQRLTLVCRDCYNLAAEGAGGL